MIPTPPALIFRNALVLSTCTLALVACQPKTKVDPNASPFTEAEERRLRQIVREEVAGAEVSPGTVATDRAPIRKEIDKLVLAKVREELENVDWKGKLESEEVVRVLRSATGQAQPQDELAAIDLSGISTVEGKIKRIVDQIKAAKSFHSGSELEKQLIDLGPQAKMQLAAFLDKESNTGQYAPQAGALANALKTMLTPEDKDIFLKDLQSGDPRLTDLAISMHVQAAGDFALEKLKSGSVTAGSDIHTELYKVALEFHEEEAVPIILDLMQKSPSGSYLARMVDEKFPDLEMTAPLQAMATKASTFYETAPLAELMLKRGLPEGLEMAASALGTDNGYTPGGEHYRERIRNHLRRYANVTGSDAEVAKWLLDNRNRLKWNPTNQVFEEQ